MTPSSIRFAAQSVAPSKVNPAGRISTSSQPLPAGGAGRVSSQQVTQPAAPPKPTGAQVAAGSIASAGGKIASSGGLAYQIDPVSGSANTVKNRLSAELKAQGWTVKAAAWSAKKGQYKFTAMDPDGDVHTFTVNNPAAAQKAAQQPTQAPAAAKAPAAPPAAKAAPTVPPSAQPGLIGASKPDSAYHRYSDTDAYSIHPDFQRANWNTWESNLSSQERWAIAGYVDAKFRPMNALLRAGQFDPSQYPNSASTHMIQGLTAACSKKGLQKDTLLWRGFPSEDFSKGAGKKYKAGGVITDPGFASTSPKKETIKTFVKGGMAAPGSGLGAVRKDPFPVVWRVRAPAGTKGAYLSHNNLNPRYMHESEFLLNRGTQFRILKTGKESLFGETVTVYDLEVIGQ